MLDISTAKRAFCTTLTLLGLSCFLVAGKTEAATFELVDGRLIQGDIVDSAGGFFFIRQEVGGVISGGLSMVGSIEIKLADGHIVKGLLTGWENGTYLIRPDETDGRLVSIEYLEGKGYLLTQITEPVETTPQPILPSIARPPDPPAHAQPWRRSPTM